MAETAGTLTTAISRRIRDPLNTAHLVVDVREILSLAQRVINSQSRAIALSIAWLHSGRTLYQTTEIGLDTIGHVYVDGKDVPEVPWQSLRSRDPFWLVQSGNTAQYWSHIGRQLFALLPIPRVNQTVTLDGVKVLDALTSAGQSIELNDRYHGAVLNLAEQLLLLRHRLYTSLGEAIKRVPVSQNVGRLS